MIHRKDAAASMKEGRHSFVMGEGAVMAFLWEPTPAVEKETIESMAKSGHVSFETKREEGPRCGLVPLLALVAASRGGRIFLGT